MEPLKQILAGTRSPSSPLSDTELRGIVESIGGSTTALDRGRQYLYLVRALEKKLVDPNALLVAAIAGLRSPLDLRIVALAMEYGANKNLYVATPSIGRAHLIVHTVVTLRAILPTSSNLLLTAVMVETLMGSQVGSPAFDLAAPPTVTVTAPDTRFLDQIAEALAPRGDVTTVSSNTKAVAVIIPTVGPKVQTVAAWLASQGYPTFETTETDLKQLSHTIRAQIGLIIDRPDLVYPASNGSIVNLDAVLGDRADKVVDRYPAATGILVAAGGESGRLVRAVEAANFRAFAHFVDAGEPVTYFTINRLCIRCRLAWLARDSILLTEYQAMLQYAVAHGAQLDIFQLKLLADTDDGLRKSIETAYAKPLWQKVCTSTRSTGTNDLVLPDEVKTLAFALDVDPMQSHADVCAALTKLNEADAASLKAAALLKQKARVGASVSTIGDFITGVVPALTCANKAATSKHPGQDQDNPFAYNDATMTFYRDTDNRVWCFTSPSYEQLLATGVNPHTNSSLPEEFKGQVRTHLALLKYLGVPIAAPMTVSTAITKLREPDGITDSSASIVATVVQAAKLAGVEPTYLKALPPARLNAALATIGMDQPMILITDPAAPKMAPMYMLTADHQFATFCRAAYTVIKNNPATARAFFNTLTLPS